MSQKRPWPRLGGQDLVKNLKIIPGIDSAVSKTTISIPYMNNMAENKILNFLSPRMSQERDVVHVRRSEFGQNLIITSGIDSPV